MSSDGVSLQKEDTGLAGTRGVPKILDSVEDPGVVYSHVSGQEEFHVYYDIHSRL